MGLDTSAHPFDVKLLHERIVPAILHGESIDDLFEQSAKNQLAAFRANEWGLAVVSYERQISDAQASILKPERDRWFRKHKKAEQVKKSFLGRLLGRKLEDDLPKYPAQIRLPGFNSDLSIWGRPFFITVSLSKAVSMLDRYLDDGQDKIESIDLIAQENLAALEAVRLMRPDNVRKDLWATIVNAGSIASLTREIGNDPPRIDDLIQFKKKELELWQLASKIQDPDQIIECEFYDDPIKAGSLHYAAPHEILSFMSTLSPGWMSRGKAFASNLFNMLNIAPGFFETPQSAFQPLVKSMPGMISAFHTSIPENYALGGYVPPEKVPEFINILDEFETDMVLAFVDTTRDQLSSNEFEQLQADWLKIREAAEYAKTKGFGYLEASEIYSGFLGVMN